MKQILFLLSAIFLLTLSSSAQGTAKITIRKNIDGEETVIEREINLDDEQDIEEFHEDQGIDVELNLDDDETRLLEIIIEEEAEAEPFRLRAGCNPEKRAFLGVTSGGASEADGALVGSVIEGSTADAIGIMEGDIITSFNGKTIENFYELREAVRESEEGEDVDIALNREGKRKKLKGTLGKKETSDYSQYWVEGNDFHYEFDTDKLENLLEDLEIKIENLENNENFHFEFDSEDIDEWSENLSQQIEAWTEEFTDRFEEGHRTRTVVVILEDITSDELREVNESAEPKLRVDNDLEIDGLRFFPNPGDGNFELSFDTERRADLSLMIFDGQGKKVYYEMLGDFQGRYENRIDISRRPAGNYFLQIEQGGKTFSKKIVKE